jgi:hypothetical protein
MPPPGSPAAVLPELGSRWAVGLATAATLGVAAALLLFAHPQGDDFCSAVSAREQGVLGAVRHDYLHWGGRWAGHVVVVGFPALLDPTRAYPLALAGCFAASLIGLRLLLGSVAPLRGEARRSWALALVLFALHWAGMAAPGQSVYWFEGAAIYSLNLSLACVVVAGLLRLPRPPTAGRRAAGAALALLAAVVAAFHELFGLVLAGVLALGSLVAFATRDPRRLAWTLASVAACAGVASVVLAPGTQVRQPTLNPEGADPWRALGAVLAMWVRVLDAPGGGAGVGSHVPVGWVADVRLLAASVLLATGAPPAPDWLQRHARLWQVVAPAGTVAILSGAFLAGGLALGRTLPLRALDALHLVFLLGWFLTVFVFACRDAGAASPADARVRVARAASAALLALGLLVSANVKHGLRDLARGRATGFDRAMEARYAEARRAREAGARELVLRPIEPWPSSYFRNDVGDLTPPLRECVARYFELESVRVAPSE